ncbi:hypothetical protein DXG01_010989 [Tephrocybe rancida]|nr:hypothetical protein DXG01_010989 [Tephrocybe rancida]
MDAALYNLEPSRVTTPYGVFIPQGDVQLCRYGNGTGDKLHVSLGSTALMSGKTMFDMTTFKVGELTYKLFDLGGQRSEMKKWIHYFENVTALVFLVSLSEYDKMLYEDKNVNQMQEALTLFDSICNSHWFVKTTIILFLNKIELFAKKLSRSPLGNYFPDFIRGDNYNAACEYLLHQCVICSFPPFILLLTSVTSQIRLAKPKRRDKADLHAFYLHNRYTADHVHPQRDPGHPPPAAPARVRPPIGPLPAAAVKRAVTPLPCPLLIITAHIYSTDGFVTKMGGLLTFQPALNGRTTSILVCVGMSFISSMQACANAEEEVPDFDFDGVHSGTTSSAGFRWTPLASRLRLRSSSTRALVAHSFDALYTSENPKWKSKEPYYDSLYCNDGSQSAVAQLRCISFRAVAHAILADAENESPNWNLQGRQANAWKKFNSLGCEDYIPQDMFAPGGANTKQVSQSLESSSITTPIQV